jgi:heparan sulfate N-deacetylase/N-sulfotransferase NDST2
LLIDIDDVFVGTTRFVPSDVAELLASQKRIAAMVPGFRYNLGFSGGFYHKVQDPAALQGDDELLVHKDAFWWFPHMWRHLQPHTFDNATELVGRMMLNKRFSEEYGIRVSHNYSVAPHHSGVYPVHEPLYQAWRKVWGIEVSVRRLS